MGLPKAATSQPQPHSCSRLSAPLPPEETERSLGHPDPLCFSSTLSSFPDIPTQLQERDVLPVHDPTTSQQNWKGSWSTGSRPPERKDHSLDWTGARLERDTNCLSCSN